MTLSKPTDFLNCNIYFETEGVSNYLDKPIIAQIMLYSVVKATCPCYAMIGWKEFKLQSLI